jgi:hypothetical protein
MAEINYIGVRWITETQKWQSVISHKGIRYNCGSHVEQKDAIKARDRKIIEKCLPVKLQYLKPLSKSKSI